MAGTTTTRREALKLTFLKEIVMMKYTCKRLEFKLFRFVEAR